MGSKVRLKEYSRVKRKGILLVLPMAVLIVLHLEIREENWKEPETGSPKVQATVVVKERRREEQSEWWLVRKRVERME